MYKQLMKLTMSRLPAGALTMTFVIYNLFFIRKNTKKVEEIPNKNHI